MPVTHIVFLIACLAISGIPPFAGFYSKEMILGAAYQTNQIIFFTGIITAGLTAFYMFRLYFSIFWRDKAAQGERVPAHGSAAMLIPLAILAIGALTAGFIPFAKLVTYNGQPLQIPEASIVSIMAIFIAVASILISALLYMKENLMPAKLVRIFGDLHRVIFRKFFIDEIYIFITRKIIFNLIARPAAWMDRNIVDGSINLIASGTTGFAKNIKTLQSGRLQGYMTWFLGGLLILIMIFMMVN
jgi:NADH-quinone oxidoreductase subunit L